MATAEPARPKRYLSPKFEVEKRGHKKVCLLRKCECALFKLPLNNVKTFKGDAVEEYFLSDSTSKLSKRNV